jgi:hypothetical protein
MNVFKGISSLSVGLYVGAVRHDGRMSSAGVSIGSGASGAIDAKCYFTIDRTLCQAENALISLISQQIGTRQTAHNTRLMPIVVNHEGNSLEGLHIDPKWVIILLRNTYSQGGVSHDSDHRRQEGHR